MYKDIPFNHEDFRQLGPNPGLEYEGKRLDFYLAQRFKFLSRANWQRKIKEGQVVVNGDSCFRSHKKLLELDHVQYYCPRDSEPEVDTKLKGIWQDEGILGVCKTPNLPMHEAGVYRLNTFCRVVKEQFGDEWAAVHRLDRETSGLVLCAVPELRNTLCAALRERTMKKVYLAIGKGEPKSDAWFVDQPLGHMPPTAGLRTQHGIVPDGAPSQTSFEVLEVKNGYTLMRVQPHTGRTHQIRIHAAWSGLPLVGDKRYQSDPSLYAEYLDHGFTERIRRECLFDRLCLHAHALTFIHPVHGCEMTLEAPMPDDMHDIWDRLKSL